ncbi:hypothetical protein GCM10010124_28120 [Pilimelia terevasa]|uniref:ABC1 atypical kinase-like domain-containing protein n=1 Tax=Pilimelia terevasa TaxID=53372 RepID=A0A8J3BN92_9ACTN|nr:hypothetical protein GCM10010124_28120 [Pilimelia terevasa]
MVLPAAVEAVRTVCWTAALLAGHLAPGRRDPRRAAALLRRYLYRMGPLYLKAGQILGTQSGLWGPGAAAEFRSFFAGLPPMAPAALRRTLARSLGAPADRVFASFDWTPVAAGTVAQVHRATLPSGEAVAVKVVKEGVPERLHASARVLGLLLHLAHLLVPACRRFDLRGQFAELRPALLGQFDLRAEARHQDRIRENFAGNPRVGVPRLYPEHCTDRVLVMEFVDGVPGHEADRLPADRRPDLAARVQEAFYCMAYFHGRFHVDPHPGNVVFGAGGEVVFLDFGLVGVLSEDDRWHLSAFYYACVRGRWELAADRFTGAFVVGGDRLSADCRTELADVLRHHFEDRSRRWSTMAFFRDAAMLLHRRGARLSTRITLLALALLTGEGFVYDVDPGFDLWTHNRRFTDRFSPYQSDAARETFRREIEARAPRAAALRAAAADTLVAPTHLDRFVLPSTFPLVVRSAAGARLTDVDGNVYLDLSGGYGPHILGYGHPVVREAIHRAVADGAVNALGNPAEFALARLLAQAFPGQGRALLCNSGTEAVLVAIRLARAWTNRRRVAKCEGHYHGFSDHGQVSSWFRYSGDPHRPRAVANSAGADPRLVADTVVLQYGDPASFDRIAACAAELACVIVEPMPAALAEVDRGFLRRLRQECDRHGIVLIFDEVVTGFRVDYGGAQRLAGVRPDLTCAGKIIGGGLPCGAVVGRPHLVDLARTTHDPFLDVTARAFVGGTMSGNSVTAAAGAATLGHLRAHPEIYPALARRTDLLTGLLTGEAAAAGVPCRITGSRSIFSVTFDHASPRRIRDRLAGSHLQASVALAYYLRKHGVYLPELHTAMLSAAHTEDDLAQVAGAFGKSVREMADAGFFAH